MVFDFCVNKLWLNYIISAGFLTYQEGLWDYDHVHNCCILATQPKSYICMGRIMVPCSNQCYQYYQCVMSACPLWVVMIAAADCQLIAKESHPLWVMGLLGRPVEGDSLWLSTYCKVLGVGTMGACEYMTLGHNPFNHLYTNVSDPDSKVHGANMGPIWGGQDPGGPHVGPMNFAIWEGKNEVDAKPLSEPMLAYCWLDH